MSEQTSADDAAVERLATAGLSGTSMQSDDGFLPFDPKDKAAADEAIALEKEFASNELLGLLEQVERDVKPWIPTTIGESLMGTVVDVTWVENSANDFDDYWMVTIETPSGRMLAFHAYHTVIAKNVAQKKESGELSRGAQIAISYRGDGVAKAGRSGAKMYNMALIPVQ